MKLKLKKVADVVEVVNAAHLVKRLTHCGNRKGMQAMMDKLIKDRHGYRAMYDAIRVLADFGLSLNEAEVEI